MPINLSDDALKDGLYRLAQEGRDSSLPPEFLEKGQLWYYIYGSDLQSIHFLGVILVNGTTEGSEEFKIAVFAHRAPEPKPEETEWKELPSAQLAIVIPEEGVLTLLELRDWRGKQISFQAMNKWVVAKEAVV
ncbi:MAG: hypothetical protein V1838_04455 [Patescibacteria group bacterium]